MIISTKKELLGFICEKSLALVGPSPHLEGMSIGSDVDAYDLVARVNEVESIKNPEDYGSRTDIVFFGFSPYAEPTFESFVSYCDCKQLPLWVVCPRPSIEAHLEYVERLVASKSNPLLRIVFLDGVDLPRLSGKPAPAFPTTGFLAMMFLMQAPLRGLFISGFSFYSGFRSYNRQVAKSQTARKPIIHVSAHHVREEVKWLQALELPEWVDYDDMFSKIVMMRKYIGRNPLILVLQIIKNSFHGLRSRLRLNK